MAKKAEKNINETNNENSVPRSKFLLGMTLICLGILLFIALGSFIITGGADRSIFDLPLYELITNPDIETRNPLGKLGAWVADMLVTDGVGLMAIFVPWLLAASGLFIMGIKKVSLPRQLAYCIGFAIWGSIALGFATSKLSDQTYLLLGGAHGHFMSKWLNSAIGPIGTFALLSTILLGFIATKNDALRSRIISILQKAHINLPNIPISTDEGKVRPALAEDEEYDEQENDNNSRNSAEQTPPDDQDDTNQDDTDQDVTPDDQPTPDDTKGDMVIEYATPEDNTTEEDTPDTDYQPQKAESEFEIIQKTDKDDEASPDVLAHGIETEYDPREDLSNYEFPSFDLLKDYGKQNIEESQEKLFENKDKIVQTLENFQIKITSIKATVGPTVTLYEIVPAPGIRISKIKNLEDDIAMSLAALGIRIMAPIPGLGTIGIEVPNSKPQIVSMMSVIKSSSFQESQAEIPIAIGKTISNETFVFDLAKTPHLLVAGATGQGKSVGLNAIITSILYRKHPSEIKFVLVDPKMVEFSVYKSLDKHYLAKMESGDEAVITDFDKVKSTLLSINVEMDNRYRLLEKASVRNIKEYNEKFIARRLNPNDDHRFLPYLVVIIDEFADLIMTAGKEVETPIARIAQKARAVGIHMILATQRPSTNIITGVIKANFPSRIAFKVASGIDSRTILDSTGAQSLIGRGDMLVLLTGKMTPTRVQCAFVDTPEVERINNFISSQQGYIGPYELPDVTVQSDGSFSEANDGGDPGKFDSKIREIALMVVESQIGSTSNIQRRFEVGYNRAGKIMDQLERMGIVSPADGSKPRAVYVQTEAELENILQRFGV